MAPQRDQVADRIRLLLEEHSWSEYELAKRAGLSDSHIGLILKRGTARTQRQTLEKIAAGAGVSTRWLLEGEGPREAAAPPTELQVVRDGSDPKMRNRDGFDRHLSAAKRLRSHADYVWDAVGDGDPLILAPLSPALLADLADVLAKYVAPPPGHTPPRSR